MYATMCASKMHIYDSKTDEFIECRTGNFVIETTSNNAPDEITFTKDELYPRLSHVDDETYAIDLGYNIRIMCDREYLRVLNYIINADASILSEDRER